MDWKKLLGSVPASVDEELRLRNAYLVAENRVLRQQISGRVRLTDGERRTLAEVGQPLGKQALEEIAAVAKADPILAWHRKFVDQQCESSPPQKSVGRPRVDQEIEDLVVRMACENRSWGYDRIVGALTNLGYTISDQTVGNILKRHGIPPAPERKKTVTWREFIRFHLDVLLATDFFNAEVGSWVGLAIASLLGFLHGCRGQVSSVHMILPHPLQWIQSLLSRSLAVNAFVQRGMCVGKASGRLRPMLRVEGGRGHTVSARASSVEAHARGKVVLLCASSPSQRRDGPARRRPRLTGLLQDDRREAA